MCLSATLLSTDRFIVIPLSAGGLASHSSPAFADLFTPIRLQGLGNSADGRFIVGEEFGRVLVRAGTPVRPHSAGFKGANRHAERRQFLSERFREASNGPFRSM